MTEQQLPQVKPDDGDDVSLALETAATLWANDNQAEALRWLRKAADAAEQMGNDLRALELARAAADLRNAERPSNESPMADAPGALTSDLPSPASLPGAVATPEAGTARRGSLPPKPAKRVLPGTGGSMDAVGEEPSRRPPPPSSMRSGPSSTRPASLVPGAPPKPKVPLSSDPDTSGFQAAAASREVSGEVAAAGLGEVSGEDSPAPVTTASPSGVDDDPSEPSSDRPTPPVARMAVSSQLPASVVAASSEPVQASVAPGAEAADAPRQGTGSLPPAPAKPSAGGTRAAPHDPTNGSGARRLDAGPLSAPVLPTNAGAGVQVAIKQSARDEGLFLVRRLGAGETPPPGYRIAILITEDGSLT